MGTAVRWRKGCVLTLALLAAGAPAFGQGVLNVSVASIPSAATRVVAIADGTAVSSPVYAIQNVAPAAGSAALSMSLPGGTYRVRVLADGASRTLLASAKMTIQVPDGNSTGAFIALAPVSVTVDSSTPSTAKAGSPVTIVFDITDWGDVLESANAQLFTSTSAFAVATGGVLTASVTPVKVVSGSYSASFSVTPAIGSTLLTYALRASIPIGTSDCPYLYSPDPATRPSQPWQMPVVAQAGAAVTVSGIPSNASRLVVIADVQPAPPFYAQRAVTLGTASAAAFIALPANTYRIRVLADSPTAGMLAGGQTTATVSSGATATVSVSLTAMTVTLDASTPATAAAASSVAILFNVVDAGNVLSGVYAYLWAGLAPFGVAGGGNIAGVAGFSSGSTTVQAGFSILMPAGTATFNYVLRAQVWTGVDYSLLASPNPAQAPNAPWQIQSVVTTGVSLNVTNIPSGAVRLVVLADGPLPTVVSSEQAVPAGATAATILVAVPAGTYRLRALVDASAGDIIGTGQVSAVAPATGSGTASAVLSPPVVTLGASTPALAQAGAVVMLGFKLADAGDVLENANASLYTGSAPFNLVTGGFLLGLYPLTKVSPGQYTVAFSDTAPSTASTLYFGVRIQVVTGLTPSFLDSPDPNASSLPWSMAITLPGTQPCTPVAAFRDTSGSLRLIYYGTTTVQFLGGQLASDPVVAQSPGCMAYVAARDNYNFVWMAVVDPIAVARNGVVYIGGRDIANSSFWLIGYTPGAGFGPWIFIGGVLGSGPAMAASPDGSLYMLGRDLYSAAWSAWYVPGSGFQGWTFLPSGIQGLPSVAVGTDACAYITIRDAYNYLWLGRVQGTTFLGWTWVGGVLYSDPQTAASGDGTIYTAMLDEWDGVWYRARAEGAAGAWQPWVYAAFTLQSVASAATPGQLYLAGRDSSNALWWYRSTTGLWSAAGGNGLTAGSLAAAPR